MKKKLPIGIESFNEIRNDGFYYVDKTRFIKDLLYSGSKVNLFTRPRRFGKSLNMDMLKAFFEIGADVSLFNGLEISKEKELCDKYMGKFPVLFVSFKSVEGTTFEDAKDMLESVVRFEANRFSWLMDSDKLTKYDKIQFEKLLLGDFSKISYLADSLKLLTLLLYKHYGKKAIVLIDEYDVPLDKAHSNGYYPEMVNIIRLLFSEVLKTNNYLQFAVITGCLRISKESIFTGLNNFIVFTTADTAYAPYFGFTSDEVKELLDYYNLEEKFCLFKEWYDGYKFGGVEIYCPWDVINQCSKLCVSKKADMESHWVNSSSNDIIRNILQNSTATTREYIEKLISGEQIKKMLYPELTYADLDNRDNEVRQDYLWSVLYAAGYLTDAVEPKERIHTLIIPNKEIHEIYEKHILSWFKEKTVKNSKHWNQFCTAVEKGEAKEIELLFNKFMTNSISIRDTYSKKAMKENFYHGMLLGLLQTNDDWIVKSNQESGTGYADILVKIQTEKIGCIFEIKYAENGKFDTVCNIAMQQIKKKAYIDVLKQDDVQIVRQYAVACYKKTCKVLYSCEKTEL